MELTPAQYNTDIKYKYTNIKYAYTNISAGHRKKVTFYIILAHNNTMFESEGFLFTAYLVNNVLTGFVKV